MIASVFVDDTDDGWLLADVYEWDSVESFINKQHEII